MCGRYAFYGPIPRVMLPALALWLLVGCGRFPESCFNLSPSSRLPAWFSPPAGTSREDLTVHMCYYSDQPTATFELRNLGDGSVLAKADGSTRGSHPLTAQNTERKPLEYPSYEIVTVGEITEVVEHRRMEPVFYVVDDPSIRRALGVDGN